MSHPSSHPISLTIAGSDNSAGAGIQADLKTFTACGVYGLTALTCVVAEVPGLVAQVQAVDLDVIRAQITLSLSTYPVGAIKTGLLHSRAAVELVADLYEALDPATRPPLVVDPVMVATSGRRLLSPDAVGAYETRLFPLATVVTPNLDEAAALLAGRPLADIHSMRTAGHELAARYGTAILLKGGHLGGDDSLDLLCTPGGQTHESRARRVRDVPTHGTGCTYSAALAAYLARGVPLLVAVQNAKLYVTLAIARSHRWQHRGHEIHALNHDASDLRTPK